MAQDKIVILYAGDLEGKTILSSFENHGKIEKGIYTCGKFLIYKTGIGKKRTQKALKKLFALYPVKNIFSLGIAGGLSENLKCGDIFASEKVVNVNGTKALEEFEQNSSIFNEFCFGMCKTLSQIKRGTLLTVDNPLTNPKSKKEYKDRFEGNACDMETAIIAEFAGKNHVPLYSFRIISDTYNQKLPDVKDLFTNEKKNILRKFKFIVNPVDFIRILKFKSGLKKSLKNLKSLVRYITNECTK